MKVKVKIIIFMYYLQNEQMDETMCNLQILEYKFS
jgi:hypothetical protein